MYRPMISYVVPFTPIAESRFLSLFKTEFADIPTICDILRHDAGIQTTDS